jgi:hypothetical protein
MDDRKELVKDKQQTIAEKIGSRKRHFLPLLVSTNAGQPHVKGTQRTSIENTIYIEFNCCY